MFLIFLVSLYVTVDTIYFSWKWQCVVSIMSGLIKDFWKWNNFQGFAIKLNDQKIFICFLWCNFCSFLDFKVNNVKHIIVKTIISIYVEFVCILWYISRDLFNNFLFKEYYRVFIERIFNVILNDFMNISEKVCDSFIFLNNHCCVYIWKIAA